MLDGYKFDTLQKKYFIIVCFMIRIARLFFFFDIILYDVNLYNLIILLIKNNWENVQKYFICSYQIFLNNVYKVIFLSLNVLFQQICNRNICVNDLLSPAVPEY